MKATALILLAAGTLPMESLAFQGIAKTTAIAGQTPPPKSRVEPPPSQLSMGIFPDVSFFTDLVPDIRVLRYIQLTLADPENTPIILSAVSSFLVLAGIWSTTPVEDTPKTVPVEESTSFSSNSGYASVEMGGFTYQATLMEPPTTTGASDPFKQQRSFSRVPLGRGMNARGSVRAPPPATKLPAMQGEDRYKPLSYAPMSRPGGTSALKSILTASSSSTVEKPGSMAATPKKRPLPPKRFSSSKLEVSNSFDGPMNPGNKKAFDWAPAQRSPDPRTGDTVISSTEKPASPPYLTQLNSFDGPMNPGNKKAFDWAPAQRSPNPRTGDTVISSTEKPASPPYSTQLNNEQDIKIQKPASYAPTTSSSSPVSSLSASSYLESLGGAGSKPKQSSYAPTKPSVTAIQVPNALNNSYFQAMGLGTASNRVSSSLAELPSPRISQATSLLSPSAAQLQDTGSYLEIISGGAKMKESSYAPTKASVVTKETGNALGSSYFAAMGSGRSAPTTVYQYSPTELAARAALNPAAASITVSSSLPQEMYSSDSLGSSEAEGSYLDTVGGASSSRKESSYAPTKPSVMTKPMGNAMGSTYFSSMGASGDTGIPSSYSYLLSDDPEPPTAGAMKPYLSTLSKEDTSGTRPSSYAPTKTGVGKMSSTTVGSSYLQMMGRTSSSAKSQYSADPGLPSSPSNSKQSNTAPKISQATHSKSSITTEEAGSYLDFLSGGKQSSLPSKRSFAPTQPSAAKKSGMTIGSSYLTSISR